MVSLNNKNVVLTGATAGIGKSLLLQLLHEGANVVFCGRSQQKMDGLLFELKKLSNQSYHYQVFDMADEKKLYGFIDFAYERFSKIDLLINCAGLNTGKSEVLTIDLKALELMMQINFVSPLICMQEIGKRMKEEKQGTIVNILSTVCLFSNELNSPYTASKAALDSVTKIFNKEMREHNVRVVSVYPGGANTDFRELNRPDYLPADEVAEIIIANLKAANTASLDEIVFRPMIEKNFK